MDQKSPSDVDVDDSPEFDRLLKACTVCHVLIIEDEALIAMIVQDMLLEEGATSFDFAVSQDEAIDAALARRPDIITSDVKLVEGTGPLAVDAILRSIGPIPVIFITGTPEDCCPCAPPGRILSKPIDKRALADAFHELGPA